MNRHPEQTRTEPNQDQDHCTTTIDSEEFTTARDAGLSTLFPQMLEMEARFRFAKNAPLGVTTRLQTLYVILTQEFNGSGSRTYVGRETAVFFLVEINYKLVADVEI